MDEEERQRNRNQGEKGRDARFLKSRKLVKKEKMSLINLSKLKGREMEGMDTGNDKHTRSGNSDTPVLPPH